MTIRPNLPIEPDALLRQLGGLAAAARAAHRQCQMASMRYLVCVALSLVGWLSAAANEGQLVVMLRNNAGQDRIACVEQDARTSCVAPGRAAQVHFSREQWIDIGVIAHRYLLPASMPQGTQASPLYLQLEPDGRIFMVLPDSDGVTRALPEQPPGFPLVPTEKVDQT